jgi:hypothetical protein
VTNKSAITLFIAAQIKEFAADEKIRVVMTVLDWSDRELYFPHDGGETRINVKVDDALLSGSPLPHEVGSGFWPKELLIMRC